MLDRRTLLSSMVSSVVSLPFFCKYFKTRSKEEGNGRARIISTPELHGICMLYKFVKQHRWDICRRFIDKCYVTYPDIPEGMVERVFQANIYRMLANKDNIHYIQVHAVHNPISKYYMTFTYVNSDECYATPIC